MTQLTLPGKLRSLNPDIEGLWLTVREWPGQRCDVFKIESILWWIIYLLYVLCFEMTLLCNTHQLIGRDIWNKVLPFGAPSSLLKPILNSIQRANFCIWCNIYLCKWAYPVRGVLTKKNCCSFGFCANDGWGKGPAQIFCHPFISAFLVNKRSLFPPKCQ